MLLGVEPPIVGPAHADHILLGRGNVVRMDYMSGEIRGGLGEMMIATTDSVL